MTVDPAAFLASLSARPALGTSGPGPRVAPDDATRIRDLPVVDYTELDFVEYALLWAAARWSRGPDAPMQFRPIQAVALLVCYMTGGALFPIGTGWGKTLIVLLAADALGARRPLLLVPPALRVSLETSRGDYDRSFKIPRNLRVMAYSQLSVASNTAALERLAPDVIVCDECFPFQIIVRTDQGPRPIGVVVERGVGSKVLSRDAAGNWVWRRIIRRMRNKMSESLVRVTHTHGTLLCTSTHKVWTERGYVEAVHLHDGDRLRVLRTDCYRAEEGRRYAEVLQSFVLHETSDATARSYEQATSLRDVCGESRESRSTEAQAPCNEGLHRVWDAVQSPVCGEVERQTNVLFQGVCKSAGHACVSQGFDRSACTTPRQEAAGEQPDAQSGDARQDACVSVGTHVPIPRREREDDRTPTHAGGSPLAADGVRHPDSRRHRAVCETTDGLQSRPCITRTQVGDRGGRALAQDSEVETHRRAQGGRPALSRVVRVEVLEPGSLDRLGEGCRDYPFLYDLEVEETHNYVADGVLVSNCHNLRHEDAARTKRVARYFKAHPETRFVPASGTLTSKRIADYAHLSKWALGDKSPVPLPEHFPALQAFGNVLDAKPVRKDGDSRYVMGAQGADFARFSPLFPDWLDYSADVPEVDPYAEVDAQAERVSPRVKRAREMFQARLRSAPGVVATSESSIGCALYLIERPLAVPQRITDMLEDLDATWRRPDGEELVLTIDVWRCGRQISQGFYYRWKWPDGEVDKDWMRTRSAWHREVNVVLRGNREHLDSPALVRAAAHSELGYDAFSGAERTRYLKLVHSTKKALEGEDNVVSRNHTLLQALREWTPHSRKRWRGRPTPPTETVWVDKFLVQDALAWFKEHPLGLMWYADHAVGDALAEAGVPVFGAGTDPEAVEGAHGMALSIAVHKDGKNLQGQVRNGRRVPGHSENLVLNFSPSGTEMEQLLARTHRSGQEADEVTTWFYGHTAPARNAVASACNDARYQEGTMGTPQKLCYGQWLKESS